MFKQSWNMKQLFPILCHSNIGSVTTHAYFWAYFPLLIFIQGLRQAASSLSRFHSVSFQLFLHFFCINCPSSFAQFDPFFPFHSLFVCLRSSVRPPLFRKPLRQIDGSTFTPASRQAAWMINEGRGTAINPLNDSGSPSCFFPRSAPFSHHSWNIYEITKLTNTWDSAHFFVRGWSYIFHYSCSRYHNSYFQTGFNPPWCKGRRRKEYTKKKPFCRHGVQSCFGSPAGKL